MVMNFWLNAMFSYVNCITTDLSMGRGPIAHWHCKIRRVFLMDLASSRHLLYRTEELQTPTPRDADILQDFTTPLQLPASVGSLLSIVEHRLYSYRRTLQHHQRGSLTNDSPSNYLPRQPYA